MLQRIKDDVEVSFKALILFMYVDRRGYLPSNVSNHIQSKKKTDLSEVFKCLGRL